SRRFLPSTLGEDAAFGRIIPGMKRQEIFTGPPARSLSVPLPHRPESRLGSDASSQRHHCPARLPWIIPSSFPSRLLHPPPAPDPRRSSRPTSARSSARLPV